MFYFPNGKYTRCFIFPMGNVQNSDPQIAELNVSIRITGGFHVRCRVLVILVMGITGITVNGQGR